MNEPRTTRLRHGFPLGHALVALCGLALAPSASAAQAEHPSGRGGVVVGSAIHVDLGSVEVDGLTSTSARRVRVTPVIAHGITAQSHVRVAGTGVDVRVHGAPLPRALRVTFHVRRAPGPHAVAVVLHRTRGGRWQIRPASRVSATEIRLSTRRLSVNVPAWLNPVPLFTKAVNVVTGRTAHPLCPVAPPWAAAVPPPSGLVHVCVKASDSDGTGRERAEVQAWPNRRGTAMFVDVPADADYVWVKGQPDWLRGLLGRVLGFDAHRRVLLFPDNWMATGFVRGTTTTASTQTASVGNKTLLVSLFYELTDQFLAGRSETLDRMLGLVLVQSCFTGLDGGPSITPSLDPRHMLGCMIDAFAGVGADSGAARAKVSRLLVDVYGVPRGADLDAATDRLARRAVSIRKAAKLLKIVLLAGTARDAWVSASDALNQTIPSAGDFTLQLRGRGSHLPTPPVATPPIVTSPVTPPVVTPPVVTPPVVTPPVVTPPVVTPPVVVTPQPQPRPVRGYHIEDSFFGGTWGRTDPHNGTWHRQGNRPANGAHWFGNGHGVGVDCAAAAAPYQVRFVGGRVETWNTWFHVTDGTWYPSAATREIFTNGFHGLPAC